MPNRQDGTDPGPVIAADVSLPEITIKGVVLSVVLAAVLAGANAYLGLFAGMTVSASIPAAVVSMAVLRFFRRSNILENNIVQTAASSGEALAAGVIFTIPALLLIGYWTRFEYWQTTAIALVGGLLGVLFTIPLRRALILGARLRFPEGVATAEVLKTGSARRPGTNVQEGSETSVGVRTLFTAAIVGGTVKLGESGLRLWTEAWEGTTQIGRSVVYLGINLSPALLAVGFIIGLNTASVVFLGGALGWLVLMPAYGALIGMPDGMTGAAAAQTIWSTKIRYVGIGAMLVGGLWSLVQLREPVLQSLHQLATAYSNATARLLPAGQTSRLTPIVVPRTERDASLPWIITP
ncbi:MAG TPA: oligopeptide transporter, OPT family, partial [Nitrospiraceae bacterium]|nr:oligopeptide transporter, OPT family [Nitrospiraceae bacterium]